MGYILLLGFTVIDEQTLMVWKAFELRAPGVLKFCSSWYFSNLEQAEYYRDVFLRSLTEEK